MNRNIYGPMYNPAAVSITGGTISGVTISDSTINQKFTTSTNPASSVATTTAIVDAYNGVVITTNVNNTQTIANPTTVANIKIFTVINNDTSSSNQTIKANGVDFVLTPGEGQTFLWDGTAWGPTDLGITEIPVIVSQGGTGASTITDHGVLLGSGTDPITALGVMTDGQLVIGKTGDDPVVASITDGEGITTTAGAGTLTIACKDASTGTKGVTVYSGSTKALAGTDTASAMTPDDVKYVLDRRIPQYYGVSWDESADTYVRTGSTAGQTCGVTLPDAFLPVHRRMRGCVVKDDGMVAYYLCATNWAYKEDGTTASNLDGTDGQVMVEIPKFYYRYGYSGTSHTWEVSPVPLTGFKVHEMFMSDDTEKDYVYVGAYEASLYDTSASLYNGQCYIPAGQSTVFEKDDDSITIATRTGWATNLTVGQKLVVSGTTSNNATFTVATIKSATAITVSEALTDETSTTAVIQAETDVTDTTGDKLSSVSGVLPIAGGSANGTRAHFRTWAENRGGGKSTNDVASAQWSQMYADAHSGLQLLYLTEYASFYSQSVLGYGIAAVGDWAAYNDYNPIAKTGNGNGIGNVSGNTATTAITTGAAAKDVYLRYRGIENWYGHLWKFVDGYKVNNNIPYLCNNFANFSDAQATTNYTNPTDANGAAITMHNVSGYQGTLELTGRAFMPASITGGAADKKITDYYYQASSWRVVGSGGSAVTAAGGGAFGLAAYDVLANVVRAVGGRLVLRKVRATSPILVTPALGTPASGDLRNCTGPTATTKGAVELDTDAEAVTGEDTERALTAANLKAVLGHDYTYPIQEIIEYSEAQ